MLCVVCLTQTTSPPHTQHNTTPPAQYARLPMLEYSEEEARAAAAGLALGELPGAWGYACQDVGGRVLVIAPDGAVGDPRELFEHYLAAWLMHHRGRGRAGTA